MSETERTVIEINKKLKREFKRRCKKEGRTMRWYIEYWITQLLEK